MDRCERIFNTTTWPHVKRCENVEALYTVFVPGALTNSNKGEWLEVCSTCRSQLVEMINSLPSIEEVMDVKKND